MRLGIKQFTTVAGLTIIETIRQPICFMVALTCVVFISLLPLLITHRLGDGVRLIRDSALAMHFLCGLLLGSFAACATLAHEIRRGTASAILSKPVMRELFFLAKITGIAVVMVLFSIATGLATIMSTRMGAENFHIDWWVGLPLLLAPLLAVSASAVINFFTQRSFSSVAFLFLIFGLAAAFGFAGFFDAHGHSTLFGTTYAWELLPSIVLIALAVIILAAMAASLATRLDVVPTVSICSVIFLIGLVSDYLLGRHAPDHVWASVLYAIIPNWQHFWSADALDSPGGISWHYVSQVAAYAGTYLVAIASIGMLAFRNMDVSS